MQATVEPDLRYLVAQGWVWNQFELPLTNKILYSSSLQQEAQTRPKGRESYYFPLDSKVYCFS